MLQRGFIPGSNRRIGLGFASSSSKVRGLLLPPAGEISGLLQFMHALAVAPGLGRKIYIDTSACPPFEQPRRHCFVHFIPGTKQCWYHGATHCGTAAVTAVHSCAVWTSKPFFAHRISRLACNTSSFTIIDTNSCNDVFACQPSFALAFAGSPKSSSTSVGR